MLIPSNKDRPSVGSLAVTNGLHLTQAHNMKSSCSYAVDALSPHSSLRDLRAGPGASLRQTDDLPTPSSSSSFASPGGISPHSKNDGRGFNYSTHWSTVLNSATISRHNNRLGSGTQPKATADDVSRVAEHSVLLFEGYKHVTEEALFESLPTRREADSLVSFYFRAQEYRCQSKPHLLQMQELLEIG